MRQQELAEIIDKAKRDRSTTLNLSLKKLNELPESIGELTNLTSLDLRYNDLSELPESICNLGNLKYLDLGQTNIRYLPKNIDNLISLEYLDICCSQISELPESLLNLPKLTSLSMCDFKGGELPEIVCHLSNLNNLVFMSGDQGGVCNDVPDKIIDLIGNLTNLIALDLTNIALGNIENLIERITNNLRFLYLPGNLIEILPENIGRLTQLELLDLSMNQLVVLPKSIGRLKELNELNLNYNSLGILPDKIGCLTKLTKLKFAGNQITNLPNSMINLIGLTEIELDGNFLTDLSMFQTLPVMQTVQMFDLELPYRYWMKFREWNSEWLLDEKNAEIRRVLIEQVGYEKIYEKLGAIQINSWREYDLMRIQASVDVEPIFLLKMTCPSTGHIHILRVPPEMTSAEAAITWVNHGIHPDKFAVQT